MVGAEKKDGGARRTESSRPAGMPWRYVMGRRSAWDGSAPVVARPPGDFATPRAR